MASHARGEVGRLPLMSRPLAPRSAATAATPSRCRLQAQQRARCCVLIGPPADHAGMTVCSSHSGRGSASASRCTGPRPHRLTCGGPPVLRQSLRLALGAHTWQGPAVQGASRTCGTGLAAAGGCRRWVPGPQSLRPQTQSEAHGYAVSPCKKEKKLGIRCRRIQAPPPFFLPPLQGRGAPEHIQQCLQSHEQAPRSRKSSSSL